MPTRKYRGVTVTIAMSAIQGISMSACEMAYGTPSYMNELRSRKDTARSRTRTGMTAFMQMIPVKMVVMNTTLTMLCTPPSSEVSKST